MNYLKGNLYEDYEEAYKTITDQWRGRDNVYFALIESDNFAPYLLLDNDNWMFIYYFQDGMAFRGEDFYLSDSSKIFFYPGTGVAVSYYESSYDMGATYYIYTSNMGSTYFTYAVKYGVCDEDGNILEDKNGYVFEYNINGAKVSEMDYADFLNQYKGDYVEIKMPVSLRAALKGCPKSECQYYSKRKTEILSHVPEGGYWRDLPIDLQKEFMGASFYQTGGRTGMARRLSWDEPSLTLTCSPAQKQTERCHPSETRPLSVREYARIQSFPDDWAFSGSIGSKYKQIGNAVPVNLAYHIGRCVIAMLDGDNDVKDAIIEQ